MKIVAHIKFTGSNHKDCEKFLNGHYDNTLNYPNVKQGDGSVKEVKRGDFIVKDSDGNYYSFNLLEALKKWRS